MTDEDWLSCSDPSLMLAFMRSTGRVRHGNVRLFAVACCRRVWGLMADERSRRGADVAERFAEGAAGPRELAAAHRECTAAAHDAQGLVGAALASVGRLGPAYEGSKVRLWAAMVAMWATEPPRSFLADLGGQGQPAATAAACAIGWSERAEAGTGEEELVDAGRLRECGRQCRVLRCLFGPTSRRRAVAPALLAWCGGTIPRLAQGTY